MFSIYIFLQSRLQKFFFCPVSGFLAKKCLKKIFGEFCNNKKHISRHMACFCLFISIFISTLSLFNIIECFFIPKMINFVATIRNVQIFFKKWVSKIQGYHIFATLAGADLIKTMIYIKKIVMPIILAKSFQPLW